VDADFDQKEPYMDEQDTAHALAAVSARMTALEAAIHALAQGSS
jgi:hypothetical protein